MPIHHLGYRILGFPQIVQWGRLWSMTTKEAQHQLQLLACWANSGVPAPSDAYQVIS